MAGLALVALLALPADSRAEDLAGSEWRPVRIGAADVAADTPAFVQFKADGQVAGHGGCNRFFGPYRITGDAIAIGPLGATGMACPAPAMALEAAFFAALEAARTFRRDRTRLMLLDADRHEQAELRQTDAD